MASVSEIQTLLKRGHIKQAVKAAKDASRRRPKDPAFLEILAQSYAAVGQPKLALATYDRLARMLPRHVKPLADKAHLLQQLGDMQAADILLREALRLAPNDGNLFRMLSVTGNVTPNDPLVAHFVEAWNSGALSINDQLESGFALGQILGPDGFDYVRKANMLQRAAHPWSIEGRKVEIANLKQALTLGPWPKRTPIKTDKTPILITGMPRSGTTLVEQILSRHSSVTATGETGLPYRAVHSVLANGTQFKPLTDLSGGQMTLMAQRYLEGIQHFHNPGAIFTDKSIQSVLVMGLLHELLPQMRCIVVRRDPRDIALSIYKNHFVGGTHGYSNDLADIGQYIATMDEMISFWQELRPEAFIEVHYEDLVSAPEPETRRIVSYCGLDWEDAFLDTSEGAQSVKTLSLAQVRKPINTQSVGGWKRYQDHLGPLFEALGPEYTPDSKG